MSRAKAAGAFFMPPKPEEVLSLLIGAGHGTHLSLLALRRVHRCPIIVLMRPSLPGGFFDLRIEPRHDQGRESDICWLSDGPLNRMQPASARARHGLILLGGPSPHFTWDEDRLVTQIAELCDGRCEWQLSGSRRTPASLLAALSTRALPGLTVHAADTLPPGWLLEHLPLARQCWVSPDSASMVYESLTAGCAVGVFDLPPRGGSRVAASMADLVSRNLVTAFADCPGNSQLPLPPQPFCEADRCARRILERAWL